MSAITGNKRTSSEKTVGPVHSPHLLGAKTMTTPDNADADTRVLRLLLPINACPESRWGVQYALRRHKERAHTEVILLNIAEPVTQWEVLRFRTQQEIEQFQSERAQAFIEEASRSLIAAGIPWHGLFKQGDILFTVLDTAEELACDEIVIPAPENWLSDLLSCDPISALLHRQRGIPVVAVTCEGHPRIVPSSLQ